MRGDGTAVVTEWIGKIERRAQGERDGSCFSLALARAFFRLPTFAENSRGGHWCLLGALHSSNAPFSLPYHCDKPAI